MLFTGLQVHVLVTESAASTSCVQILARDLCLCPELRIANAEVLVARAIGLRVDQPVHLVIRPAGLAFDDVQNIRCCTFVVTALQHDTVGNFLEMFVL